MTLADLEREADSLSGARIVHAGYRLETILETYNGFVSSSLRLHFSNLMKRSLQRHPDGKDLDLVLKGVEDFLSSHKRRVSAVQSLAKG